MISEKPNSSNQTLSTLNNIVLAIKAISLLILLFMFVIVFMIIVVVVYNLKHDIKPKTGLICLICHDQKTGDIKYR